MKKIIYIIFIIVFAVATSAIRHALFLDSSCWSYVMGMVYMALCEIAYLCLTWR